MSMNIPNPFIDCSLDELVTAWELFSAPRKDGTLDHEAIAWVSEALDEKVYLQASIIPNPVGDGSIKIMFLMEL